MTNPFDGNLNWSAEQLKVINASPNVIIKGPAGSGKTLLALYKALEFARQEKSVAVIVFTKSLRTYISDFFVKNQVHNIKVFYEREYELRSFERFDIIIVDEYQDFSFNDISSFISKADIGVYIFGDDEQKLYGRTIDKDITTNVVELTKKTKFNKILLTKNFRVPKQIVNLINSVYRNNPLQTETVLGKAVDIISLGYDRKSITQSLKESPKAELKHFEDHEEQLDWLGTFLKNNTQYKNVGILLKQNESKYNGYFFDEKLKKEYLPGMIETRDALQMRSIELGWKYRSQDHLDFQKEININLMTVHSAKGLEFDCVILPFYSATNHNYSHEIPYVAFTRCKEKLIILYSGIISEEMQIVNKGYVDGKIRGITRKDDIPYKYRSSPKALKNYLEEIKSETQGMHEFYDGLEPFISKFYDRLERFISE